MPWMKRPLPRRRWFRYSLRTFFLVVTVLAAFLGWRMHIVRERAAILSWLQFREAEVTAPAEAMVLDDAFGPVAGVRRWYRSLFLGAPVSEVYLPSHVPGESVARVQRAFPEAEIIPPRISKPLTDAQFVALKSQQDAQFDVFSRLRLELVPANDAAYVNWTIIGRQPTPSRDELASVMPTLAQELEDAATDAPCGYSVEDQVEWLGDAQQLRVLWSQLSNRPEKLSQADAIRVAGLEMLTTRAQLNPQGDLSADAEYAELLLDFELVSCQDQPKSDSPLSPGERRWHAATMLAQRLCEAAEAMTDGKDSPLYKLVRSWERLRDSRLAAADLTDDDDARRTAWREFSAAAATRQRAVEAPLETDEESRQADNYYLLQTCIAAADAALARLESDDDAALLAARREVEVSSRSFRNVQIGFEAGFDSPADYASSLRRSIKARRELARLDPADADALAWARARADDLRKQFVRGHARTGTIDQYGCLYLLLLFDPVFQPAPESAASK